MMKILRNERGQGLTEYLIILILVSLVAVGAAASLGKSVKGKIKDANNRIEKRVQFGED